MAYKRKTRDEWELWINYGQGFEEVCAADTYREIKDDARAYRENCPEYPRRIVCKRVRLEETTTETQNQQN